MPFTRFLLNSDHGLSMQELYNEETVNDEDNNNGIVDSKALLDSRAVSSLVSVLRNLADLSQFAAEVFHGLQEQVAATASRSRKLASRVQQAEASLPQIEKDFLSQTSHVHYVYTPGYEWHARIRNEQNHFIFHDLPHFIMDSYEECREPPRLHTLDRFDTGGPGSCLKRYSDPTFFKRASTNSKVPNGEKLLDERNSRRFKRRRSWQQSGCFPDCVPTLDDSGRLQLSSSTFQEQFFVSQTGSTSDPIFKPDLKDKSDSLESKNRVDDMIEWVFHPSTLIQPDNTETTGRVNENVSIYPDEHTATMGTHSPAMKTTLLKSSSMRWDGKIEMVRPVGLNYVIDDTQSIPGINSYHNEQDSKHSNTVYVKKDDDMSEHGSFLKSNGDAFNDVPTESFEHDNENFEIHERVGKSEVQHVLHTSFSSIEEENGTKIVCQVGAFFEGENDVAVDWSQHNDNESETDHFVDALNTIEAESESDFERQTNNEKVLISSPNDDELLESIVNEQIVIIHHEPELDCRSLSCDNEEPSHDDLQVTFAEKMVRTPHQARETPVAFRTNGVVVGLEPSKPTIFSILNMEQSNSDASTNVSDNELRETNKITMQKADRSTKVSVSPRDPGCYNSPQGSKIEANNKDDKFYEHVFSDSDQSNLCGHSVINVPSVGSLNYDYKPKTTSPWSNDSGNKSNGAVLHSLESSPPLSPPLEHMKISHRHIDVSETSGLTLKYPKGVDNHDISIDTFSSFQLVPESVNLKHDPGSDFDDDTFCQSYDDKSDYYLSHLSDSNSEESGTEDATEVDYNGLSNGLNRISLTESTSSSPQCGQTDLRRFNVGASFVNELHSESDRSSERPIMVANDSISDQGTKVGFYHEADSSYFHQPAPQTPPLPPLQWRVSRLKLNTEGRKQEEGSGNLNQSCDANCSGPSASHLDKERDELKVNFRNQIRQVVNEKRADEKGDFLHQIRTKSFNLRRTVPVRPTYTTNSATSNKVAVILQKANAIRRAVGSDGEDDSWSDT